MTILVELQEWMGSDLSIANAAWTSTYNKEKREDKYDDTEKVSKIVRRLILDGHGTPIESVIFRFWIRMPIFTDRQHMTHRIASHNGLSGRYRTMPNDFFGIPEDCSQILKRINLQSFENQYDDICLKAYEVYNWQLSELRQAEKNSAISNTEFKRLREILRGQLPTAGMIERTTIINLRSFANYQRLRNSDHAQNEIRFVAQEMLKLIKNANICPTAIQTLEEINWRI